MTDLLTSIMGLLSRGHIDRSTAQELVRAVRAAAEPPTSEGSEAIAIIGIAAELPGAPTFDQFWDVLMAGEDHVQEAPEPRRRLCEPVLDSESPAQSYLSAAWVKDIDLFDAEFFGITPADARAMDPQQRRFLQTAYHCMEDSGRSGSIRGSRTGVYVAATSGDYTKAHKELTPSAVPGVLASFIASRLSYLFDLRGPAFITSATCASSLLALHQACLGLRDGDCEMALVGGVNLFSLPTASDSRLMDVAGIMSADHRSHPFDAHGTGIGRGEGIAALLLKPLARALRDGDRVRAVIRGSAVNNDGRSAALTAPNPKAHTELLLEAWRRAGIGPESLSYFEAHGTGTVLGDPIEIRGITDAVRRHTDRRQFIALGSVKGNIGHLVDGAAGLSGIVKAMLVLQHGRVPPTVNLHEPNRHIDFLDSPVFLPTAPHDLRADANHTEPLTAGVSCFGFNGTNVHVVLEEAPRPPAPASNSGDVRTLVFPLSAHSWDSLRTLLEVHGLNGSAARPRDLAYSLWAGREHHRRRVTILARDRAEFAATCRCLARTPVEEWKWLPDVRTVDTPGGEPDTPEGAISQQYANGQEPSWRDQFSDGPTPSLVDLPLYPFEAVSHWHGGAPLAPVPIGAGTLSTLLAVVSGSLGLELVRPDDSFIGLGGTSLSAMQIQSLLLRDRGWRLDAADLLGAEDFTELAAIIEGSDNRREE